MYPVFLNVKGKKCVIIGAGKVGERKAKRLAKEKAKITVVSKEFTPYFHKNAHSMELVKKSYSYGDIPEGTFLVFECTGGKEIAQLVLKECKEKGIILLNSATLPEISDFFVPSSLKTGGIEISMSTYGKSSSVSRALREKIKSILPNHLSQKIKLIEKVRKKLKSKGKKTKKENLFLLRISRMMYNKDNLSYISFKKLVFKEAERLRIDLDDLMHDRF